MPLGAVAAELLDVLQCRVAVFLRLPTAEKIEVRSVEDVNDRHGLSAAGGRRSISAIRADQCRRALYAPFGEGKPAQTGQWTVPGFAPSRQVRGSAGCLAATGVVHFVLQGFQAD